MKNSNKEYKQLIDGMNDTASVIDFEGKFVEVNDAAVRNLDYSREELLTMGPVDIDSHLSADEIAKLIKSMKSDEKKVFETEHRTKQGEIIPVEISSSPVTYRGKPAILNIVRNITERKKAEAELKKELREKTMLLTEIHHRVKNSLQLVASLLHLQSLKITDDHILSLFDQSRNRIFMMARVYEKLYHTKNFASIDYKEYLEDVLNDIYQSSGLSQRVSLKLDVKNVILGLDTAIPTALIINELFTNSIKHAFPGDRKGKIEVRFHMLDEETYELIYRDNGVGLPAGVDFDSTEVSGLNLVKNLAQQIEGTATLEQNDWTTFRIIFKGYEYAKKKDSHSRG